jgi:hypothetical protein
MKYCVTLCSIILCGCSTMSTQVTPSAPQQISKANYSVLVRTGHPGMDRILHEIAVAEYSQLLNINEDETQIDRGGKLEITFASASDGGILGLSSAITSANSAATGWYDGIHYWGGTGYARGTSTAIPPGSMLSWQNSTMLMTLKDAGGIRLWTANYEYKGGWEMSGFWVNSADKAARLCVKKLKDRMKRDLFKGKS